MKKIIAILLCLCVILSVVACGGGQNQEDTTDTPSEPIETNDPGVGSEDSPSESEEQSKPDGVTSSEGEQPDVTEEKTEENSDRNDEETEKSTSAQTDEPTQSGGTVETEKPEETEEETRRESNLDPADTENDAEWDPVT
jgi:hypothetical protein